MSYRSVGTKLQIGVNYVAGLLSIDPVEKSADTIETTTLDTPNGYRTFTGGMKDGGEIAITGFFEPGDVGQTAMDTAFEAGTPTAFQVIFPAPLSASWSLNGVVTKYKVGGADLDKLIPFEATIKISGKPSLTTIASAGLTALALTGVGGALTPAYNNAVRSYTFSGVTGASITVTATGANQTLQLYIDGVYSQDLTTAVASAAVNLTLNVGKKLSIIATEVGKAPIIYEVIAVKTA